MHDLAPEIAYVCDLARAWANRVDGCVPPQNPIDIDRFLRAISQQPAMQTLVPFIDPDILPAVERPRIEQAAELSRRRTVLMLLELERVLPALAEIGSRPVVLKGASLAVTVYDRPEDRWFVDLDILVEPEHLDMVYDVLGRLGYSVPENIPAAHFYDRFHFHRILVSNQGVCIEVHWAVTLPNSIYRYDLEAIRRGAVEIPLGDSSFLAPSVVDQILHGVLQSIADGFCDLRRLLDLHLLDERMDDSERRVLCARAEASNLSAGLWLQYRLREQILGIPSPVFLNRFCLPDSGFLRVVDHLRVAEGCLTKRAITDKGYAQLLHWLCTPRHLRTREMRRYIFPDRGRLLLAGLGHQGDATFWERTRLSVQRTLTTGRLLGTWARAAI